MKILHISDLHINDPLDCNEALRDVYYEEYISDLVEEIKDQQVDTLLVTGDIVNIGRVGNFSHATKVIKYLSDQLKITADKVFIVNGNHDSIMPDRCLNKFHDFRNSLNPIKPDFETDRCHLFVNKDTIILCLDSTGPNRSDGRPTEYDESTIDEIIKFVKTSGHEKIVVLSHHPAKSFETMSNAPLDESPDWGGDHIWWHGGHFYDRLSHRTVGLKQILWFSGDTHRPEYLIIDDKGHFLTTGNINSHTKWSSKIKPQAKILDTKDLTYCLSIEFNSKGHNGKRHKGSWHVTQVAPVAITSGEKRIQRPQAHVSQEKPIDSESMEIQTEGLETSISEKVDLLIYESVVKNRNYSLGLYKTSEDMTTLAWINTADIFGHANGLLYYETMSSIAGKVNEIIKDVDKKKIFLIGLESWGGILSSRVGSAINVRSCTISMKGNGEHHDEIEHINRRLEKVVSCKDVIIVFTDVVSTGSALAKLINGLKQEDQTWYCIALISDPKIDKSNTIKDYKTLYYCCGSLRLPIIDSHRLPSAELLKPNLSYVD